MDITIRGANTNVGFSSGAGSVLVAGGFAPIGNGGTLGFYSGSSDLAIAGDIFIQSGFGATTGGGNIFMGAGDATDPGAPPGNTQINGGNQNDGPGGNVAVFGGQATGAYTGGAVVIVGGYSNSAGAAGIVSIQGGVSIGPGAGGTGGQVQIFGGSIAGGGTGTSGDVHIGRYDVAGVANETLIHISSDGNVEIGRPAQPTNATTGFPYFPTCAGTPTGTPTTVTGMAPVVIDSTNNIMYFYSGGSWIALN